MRKKMNNTKIKIELTKDKIKQAASMVDMMMANGSLYTEHPMVELLDEIVNECVKQKKNETQ